MGKTMQIYLDKEILKYLDSNFHGQALSWYRKYREIALTEKHDELRLWWSAVVVGTAYHNMSAFNVAATRIFDGVDLLEPLVTWAQGLTRKQAHILVNQVIEQLELTRYAITDGRPFGINLDPKFIQNYELTAAREIQFVGWVLQKSRKKKTVAKALEALGWLNGSGFLEGRVVVKALAISRERLTAI